MNYRLLLLHCTFYYLDSIVYYSRDSPVFDVWRWWFFYWIFWSLLHAYHHYMSLKCWRIGLSGFNYYSWYYTLIFLYALAPWANCTAFLHGDDDSLLDILELTSCLSSLYEFKMLKNWLIWIYSCWPCIHTPTTYYVVITVIIYILL